MPPSLYPLVLSYPPLERVSENMEWNNAVTACWDCCTSPHWPRPTASNMCRYWNTANDMGPEALEQAVHRD